MRDFTNRFAMLLNTGSALLGPVSFPKNAMNWKLPLWLVMANLLALLLCGHASAQGPGGPESDPGAPGETKPVPKPRIRWPKALRLPDQYRSRDVDKDGQIGMYEWPRSDFATFRKLDLNHDGFLTPQELTPTSTGKSTVPVVSATQYPPDAAAVDPAASKSSESSAPIVAVPAAPASGGSSEAERFFKLLDKDNNDKVTEEEFKKSFSMPKKFADAGISLSFPVTREEFVRQYPQPAAK